MGHRHTPLLPDQLKALWEQTQDGRLSTDVAAKEQQRLVDERRRSWTEALIEEGQVNLGESLLRELGAYLGIADASLVRQRCETALDDLKAEWTERVRPHDRASVERYYRDSQGTLYELLWWHSLCWDESPLAYVNALELAARSPSRNYLDFGAGVGSGGLLFARAGFDVTLADISDPLLAFARWRFSRRNLPARFIDTKLSSLPEGRFDVVTAMDVFEHLVDPVRMAEVLWRCLKPGGLMVARLGAESDASRPQHIVTDFEPVLRRLATLGCAQVWVDEWLWGHRAFQKA